MRAIDGLELTVFDQRSHAFFSEFVEQLVGAESYRREALEQSAVAG